MLHQSFWRQLSKLGVQFVRVPKLLLPSGKENSLYIALSFLFLGFDPAGPDAGQAGFIVGQQCGDPLQNLLIEMLFPIRLPGKGEKFAVLCLGSGSDGYSGADPRPLSLLNDREHKEIF